MKKVLILYASYGGGHLSAAKSIQKYIEEHYQDVEVSNIDCMKYISNALEKLTTGAYREMAKKNARTMGKSIFKFTKRGTWTFKLKSK